MIKIPLSPREEYKLVQHGKKLFEHGNDGAQVYNSLVGFCRDNFGFWMTQEQATNIFDSTLLAYSSSLK